MFKLLQSQLRPAFFTKTFAQTQINTIAATQQALFSEYFRQLDKQSIDKMDRNMTENKHYRRIMNQWQKPLERKQIKKQKKLLNPVVPNEEDPVSTLYVHNEEEGVQLPPNPTKIFAIVRIKGLQYKVTKDDRLMSEKLDFEVGQQIELDEVLLIGTQDYTCIGRPTVSKAKVIATVEEQSYTDKTLIFKKRRRKDSQRHMGYRHQVTMLKIDRVVHEVDEQSIHENEVNILDSKPTVSLI
ncbi:50s ribosomal protein l21 [Stylonychia lemnae]|uniref:Large ribosomal subunit protein bL21m n=1 Tax=Stylonychia lemnae TaxID=5949 RepID=A0A078B8B6_STYLE|nr:50s ribosomal protein l21 [Stylonychia lemnae]|eukprot:CDW90760.1 50s ribosomal protein l21 [Stylonychia lemnae]